MILTDILGGVSSVLTGGLTGILGVGIQRIFDYKTKQLEIDSDKAKYAHEVDMKKADAEIMAQEWSARTKIAENENAAKIDIADSQAFAASFNEPQKYFVGDKPSVAQGWVLLSLDFFKGIVRPTLTLYLCVLTTLIYFHCQKMLDHQAILPDQAISLVELMVNTILYLTTSVILWWFGSRQKSQPPKLK